MLRWSAIFFLIAISAATLGYSNVAGAALDIAKVLFIIFLIPALVFLILGLFILASKP